MFKKRKRIKKLVSDLDDCLVALRELASINCEQFDADLWLAIYSNVCDVADELERTFKICRKK